MNVRDEDAEAPVNSIPRRRRQPPKTAIGAVLILVLLVNLAMSLYQLPLNRVIERRLCEEYYAKSDPPALRPDGGVDEKLCKINVIQQDLGWIQGAMETIWVVGGKFSPPSSHQAQRLVLIDSADFVMTIPIGFMAEKYGRRAILLLNLVPRVVMLSWAVAVGYSEQWLPTKAIIAAPILSVLGGDCVFNSITYALASDLTDDYVLRATYFGYMSSVSYVVALLGPALASASMTLVLWLPFLIGILLLLFAVPTISLLPTPGAYAVSGDVPEAEGGYESEQTRPLLSSPLLKARDSRTSLLTSVAKQFRMLHAIVMSHPWNFSLLLISFLLTSLASSDTKLLVQYISKRYHWAFASTGYLLSGKAIINFTLLTVVIPAILRARSAARASPDETNIRYAKICLVVSVAGASAIACSVEVWMLIVSLLVYALGSALPIFTLSLLKSPAVSPPQEDAARDASDPETQIFSIVMLVKTVGSLLGAPLMAMLWVRGIGLGGAAMGMPYFVSAACYVLAIAVFSGIRV